MAFLRGSLALSLVLAACGDKSSDDAGTAIDAPSTDAASSSMPTTGTTGGTSTTGSTGGTSETASTGVNPSTTGDASSESGEGSTTGGVACTLADQACAAVEVFGGDYEDCGTVDPWNDPTPAWQAARDCALKAASEQRAFKLITMLQGFDSQVGQAFVGLPAESFAVATFYFDGDPCGGQGCGPVVSQASCDSLAAVADCVVEPGGACLACVNQGIPVQLCGPR